MAKKELKQRRCTECKEMFAPIQYGLKITKQCGKDCIKLFADKVREKEFKQETTKMKKEFNDRDIGFWENKAERQCNKYILIRDKGKPCISCGTISTEVDYAAGHYIPKGRSAALRFNEFNIHRQCNNYCNLKNSGNLISYRMALVKLYGEGKVQWLDKSHEMPRYRIDDYKRIYKEFGDKIKGLKNKPTLNVFYFPPWY